MSTPSSPPPRIIDFNRVVFFTGAGMSAASGVPTYRGQGGIWKSYDYRSYACQDAFNRDPGGVWEFHNYRRGIVAACAPNRGHQLIAEAEQKLGADRVTVVTQNIDGLHQLAGTQHITELHGSLWRVRCDACGARQAGRDNPLEVLRCACGAWWRPDIVWFGDTLDPKNIERAMAAITGCDLLIAIGTSAVVFPAAELPIHAREAGATLIEINPEPTMMSELYDITLRTTAVEALEALCDGL